MQKTRKLVLDTFSEVYQFLKPWADDEFWDFSRHTFIPGATYVIGRKQFSDNIQQLREIIQNDQAQIILCNTHEGSETLCMQIKYTLRLDDLLHKLLILGGGDMGPEYKYLMFDHFVSKIFDYKENITASEQIDSVFEKEQKPYKFLFLNGRHRLHRYWMIKKLDSLGLLDQSIWSNLDSYPLSEHPWKLSSSDNQPMSAGPIPIKLLDPIYEYNYYQHRVGTEMGHGYVKHQLFDNKWGEIYINPQPYIDTYFSVVSETVFDYPYSFRTEKIWKPVAQGHPWIAMANAGYYRDIRNLGFQTFGHLIDESFDSIENNFDRAERISQVINDLCQQNLADFLKECYNVCKYNQQHLSELRLKIRQEFPERFFQFINE